MGGARGKGDKRKGYRTGDGGSAYRNDRTVVHSDADMANHLTNPPAHPPAPAARAPLPQNGPSFPGNALANYTSKSPCVNGACVPYKV